MPNSCTDCVNEQRIAALEEDRERNSEQHKEFYNELKESSKKETEISTRQDHIFTLLGEIKGDLKELKEKPAKKWDGMTQYILQGGTLAILAYVASQIVK